MFEARRRAFMEKMLQRPTVPGGHPCALISSAPVVMRYRHTEYEYRQDSDFYYLTGFEEPEALCLLVPQHKEHQCVMFVRPSNKEEEIWDGKRASVEDVINSCGADIAYTLDQLDEMLPKYLEGASTLYYSNGQGEGFDEKILQRLKRYRSHNRDGVIYPTCLVDPEDIFDEMRLTKWDDELELMRKAATITAEAHREAMKATRPGMYEFEIQAVVEYIFRKNGSPRNSYESIIASGPNATTLHYIQNNRRMEDGDLLLLDAGAEYAHYAADITRTFPVNGRFSAEQRTIYDLVLQAQLLAISKIKPGVTLNDVHEAVVQVITEGLITLGFLTGGDVKELIEKKAYQPFYMHSTSHWLGMDVHDRGKYKVNGKSITLEPGMVFSVEPGLYIPADTEHVDAKYWNIGIRIEDDVLVTEHGCEVLTVEVPKTIAEIETLMG